VLSSRVSVALYIYALPLS